MRLVAGVVLAAVLAACGGGATTRAPLRVLAAASLTEALTDAAEAFERSGGHEVEMSFAGSQTLLTQLVEGVEADVLATADEASMRSAVAQGLVASPAIFATNRLVVVVPASNPAHVRRPADLTLGGLKLVLAGPSVPAGRYARAALNNLGLSAALRNVVSEEDDVKGVVGKVMSGEADAGIVYATDVTDGLEDRIRAFPLDAPAVDIRYPIAATVSAAPSAGEFIAFVVSGDGADILRAAGFGPP